MTPDLLPLTGFAPSDPEKSGIYSHRYTASLQAKQRPVHKGVAPSGNALDSPKHEDPAQSLVQVLFITISVPRDILPDLQQS